MLEFCALGAMDSILKELDRGLDEEAIKIVTKQTLEVGRVIQCNTLHCALCCAALCSVQCALHCAAVCTVLC